MFLTKESSRVFHKTRSLILIFSLIFTPSIGYSQSTAVLNLPVPGTMLAPSNAVMPVLLKGMTVHTDDPFKFDFIIDSGDFEPGNDGDKSTVGTGLRPVHNFAQELK